MRRQSQRQLINPVEQAIQRSLPEQAFGGQTGVEQRAAYRTKNIATIGAEPALIQSGLCQSHSSADDTQYRCGSDPKPQ